MNTEELFQELEKPMGAFIIEQSDIKPIETANGHYYHYSDVCKLLKRLKNEIAPAIGIATDTPQRSEE